MTKFFNSTVRDQFFAIVCTILFTTTMMLSVTAPALATPADAATSTSVVLPRA